jgi:hypothetical protein
VKVIPLGNDNKTILSTFWIDQKRDLIIKVESSRKPYGTFIIDLTYELYEEKYNLPSYLEFTFTIDPSMIRRHRDMGGLEQNDESDKENKPETKTGKVYITYSNYKINRGLPDELFEEKKNDNSGEK